MLCKLNRFLSAMIFALSAGYIGYSLYTVYEDHRHPERYAPQSAPWYTGILVNGALTAAIILLLVIAKCLVGRLINKRSA